MEHKLLSVTHDVIDESLAKADAADGYLCLIGERYGDIYACLQRNPKNLSNTELEFERAIERDLPIAGIIFTPKYPLSRDKIDFDKEKRDRLDALRTKLLGFRVTGQVNNEAEFRGAVHIAAVDLLDALKERDAIAAAAAKAEAAKAAPAPAKPVEDVAPLKPPAFHFVTPFAQGMPFVGRKRELDEMNTWARTGNPMLVVEAIGGMGKSTLTHHWATEHALEVLPSLAGRFWYSFYEEGASMREFCLQALAYIEHRPPAIFRKLSRNDLRTRLTQRPLRSPGFWCSTAWSGF